MRENIVTSLVAIFIVAVVLGCGGQGGGGGGGGSTASSAPQDFQTSVTSTWNGSRITGTVKNLNSAKISFVAVRFDLVDDHNTVVRTVEAKNERGIEPDGEWKFEIEARAARARISKLKDTITR